MNKKRPESEIAVVTPEGNTFATTTQILTWKEEAKAYRRLLPFVLHVADCQVCHLEGTDVCPWVLKQWKESCNPDALDLYKSDNILRRKKNEN